MLVDTVDRKSVEHIERSHPLRVTLSQIVVDSYHVNTITCEGVEEYRESSHESLTLTSSHFGNLTLMEHGTTKDLNIVVNHFPLEVVATSCPMIMVDSLVAIDSDKVVLWISSQFAVEVGSCNNSLFVFCETTCGIFHDAKCHRHNLVESFLVDVQNLFVELVNLSKDFFALVDRSVFDFRLELFNLSFLLLS